MKIHEFTLILANVDSMNIDQADAIYAQCDDASAGVSGGVVHVHFDREAATLEDAVRSAIADIQAAGFAIDHVESDESVVLSRVNQELSHAG